MKKLLSILSAIGLVATASTGVVACSTFNAGTLTINGADDLKMGVQSDGTTSLLDQYINNKNDFRANNSARAEAINQAIASGDLDQINKAAYDVVVPVFEANGSYDMSAVNLYNALNPDPTGAHDTATTTNKLELRVHMVKLGDILYVIGKDTTNLSHLITVNADYDNPINNQVLIKDPSAFSAEFGDNLSNDNLQKIFNRPNKAVVGVKVEVVTAPKAVVDTTDVTVQQNSTEFDIAGSNLNLLTPANTTLTDQDGNKIGITLEAAREAYRTATITTDTPLKLGDYTLTYTPSYGNKIIVNVHVVTDAQMPAEQ